ncbi:3-dehydroquinate synthase [Paraflavisolibacter sp. H34]|uniref:3-dehydroquinate synthase n=1 Tax=Huijunlia imazamoxiresistens TaxID=3127457 RepID=UPI00301A6756
MQTKKFNFSRQSVDYHFDASLGDLKAIAPKQKTIVITDENVFAAHQKKLKGWQTIVLPPGEAHKTQATVSSVIEQLIGLGADRQTMLVGLGGGVITDLTGYLASTFLRGVPFGFIPSSLLAMVDASIGGKNGVDVGVYKNMVGTINQPSFLLYDVSLLKSLPDGEWRNGFAEIIKHAAIKDSSMFRQLEAASLKHYQKGKSAVQDLIKRNVLIKTKVVQADEFEKNERRLLNFGHTLAHAIETQYNLTHGEAVSIGMVFAAGLSEELLGFRHHKRVRQLIERYGLPTELMFDRQKVYDVLRSDKKKEADFMNFILLQKIGNSVIEKIPLKTLFNYL